MSVSSNTTRKVNFNIIFLTVVLQKRRNSKKIIKLQNILSQFEN